MLSDFKQFALGQLASMPPITSESFQDQTVVITGANSGLGLDAAKHLVRLRVSRLIMACRDTQRGHNARKDIFSHAPVGATPLVEVWKVDMAVKSSVVAFAERVTSELDRVDAVLLNAGIDTNVFEMADGDESTLTVNVISPFLLALALLPMLERSAAKFGITPHLTFLGSSIHIFAQDGQLTTPADGKIFLTLNDATTANMGNRYFLSKLMVGLCTRELAQKMAGTGKPTIVNCVNPGWCKTNLFRVDDGGIGGRIGLYLIGRTSEEGSRTLVHAITAGRDSHGCYLSECRVKSPSAFVRSADGNELQKRLWAELIAKLEATKPGVAGVVMGE